MKKILVAFVIALVCFIILNFIYSNVGGESFRTAVFFTFDIPGVVTLRSFSMPLGFVVICAFCLGMIFLPFLQVIPWLFRTAEMRAKEKRIRQLEKELEMTRESASMPGSDLSSSSNP